MEHIVCRKPVALAVEEEFLAAAKTLSFNAPQASEAGINDARTGQWLADNRSAVVTFNDDIASGGRTIPPVWAKL